MFVDDEARTVAYPDTLVGTDSHTTMINGLGVLGWGVGGIEAEAAMLGQPMSMLIPQVVGFKLDGELPEGATATDLVLTVTEMLRQQGRRRQVRRVLRPGLSRAAARRPRDDRQHGPEFGSTCAIFPIDAETLRYLRVLGSPEGADRARRGLRQGAGPLARRGRRGADVLSDTVVLDLCTVVPSLAGPGRPQDRVSLTDAQPAFREELEGLRARPSSPARRAERGQLPGK